MKSKTSLVVSVTTLLTAALWLGCSTGTESHKKEQPKGDRQSIERGRYLVNIAGCIDCHSQRQFEYMSGPVKPGTEGMGGFAFDHKLLISIPGVVYARNITPDSATGIGSWTDEEVIRAVTQGISKNGDSLFLMPYQNFSQMSMQDIKDIIAYIRNLPPISNKVPQRQLMAPMSVLYTKVPNTLAQNKKPAIEDKVNYGRYLVTMGNCSICHTPMNEKGEMGQPFSGGNTFTTASFTVTSANLTPDTLTGIGAWNETLFLSKFKNYRDTAFYHYDPKERNTMMPWSEFSKIDDSDLEAIFAYLRTLPPVKNKIDKYPVTKAK